MEALDFISASATNAPYGYGASISTIMSRIQRIGDRMEESQVPWQGTESCYDPSGHARNAAARSVRYS
jgi:hypothetical protein